MFGFLKDKLKGVLSKFSKKVEEEAKEEIVEEKPIIEEKVEKPEKKEEVKPKKEPEKKPEKVEEKVEKPKVEKKVEVKEVPKEKKVEPKVEVKKEVSKVEEIREPEVKVKKEEKVKEEPKVKEEKKVVVPEVKEESEVKVEKEEKVEELKPEFKIKEKPEIDEVPKKVEERVEEKEPEKKGFFGRLKESIVGKEEKLKVEKIEEPEVKFEKEEKIEEPVEIKKEVPKVEKPVVKVEKEEKEPEKKGFFGRISEAISTKKISSEKFDELFWDLELALLENNVAIEVIEKIKSDLKTELVDRPIPRGEVESRIVMSLRNSLDDLFLPGFDLLSLVKEKKPFVICFVGINGSGKTTSIAKVAKFLLDNNLSVVLAAADTFRAAAIDQLQLHADALGVKLIKQDYGSDPAAVAFDAVKHAEASKKDVVLIDTAGRLHSNVNLMDEMRKIIRVAKPDLKLFIGESITGNDCVEQAKKFDEVVGIDGIILSKADIDEKGGAAISVSYVTKKPILFLGVGQEYNDLQVFEKEKLISGLGL